MSIQIESHDDDSVTVTTGSITAHIRGGDWKDANRAAHALGAIVQASYDVNALVRKLDNLRRQVERVSSALCAVDAETKTLLEWLDIHGEESKT